MFLILISLVIVGSANLDQPESKRIINIYHSLVEPSFGELLDSGLTISL